MDRTKTLLTKAYGIIETEVNEDLQKTNPLTVRGIYLIEVDNGVVWGYDTDKYKLDEIKATIIRKNTRLETK